MSHILKNAPSQAVGKRFCAATVKVKGNQLIVQPGVSVMKEDTMIAELPSKYKVVTMDGEVITPSGKFYITTQTIDPYHLILDM